jgi:hypothetical protein
VRLHVVEIHEVGPAALADFGGVRAEPCESGLVQYGRPHGHRQLGVARLRGEGLVVVVALRHSELGGHQIVRDEAGSHVPEPLQRLGERVLGRLQDGKW